MEQPCKRMVAEWFCIKIRQARTKNRLLISAKEEKIMPQTGLIRNTHRLSGLQPNAAPEY
jgi:hypothetical protein